MTKAMHVMIAAETVHDAITKVSADMGISPTNIGPIIRDLRTVDLIED